MLPYTEIGVTIIFAVLIYKAGDLEAQSGGANNGLLWGVLSALVSCIVFFIFKSSVGWQLASQFGLFLAIGIVRALRDC